MHLPYVRPIHDSRIHDGCIRRVGSALLGRGTKCRDCGAATGRDVRHVAAYTTSTGQRRLRGSEVRTSPVKRRSTDHHEEDAKGSVTAVAAAALTALGTVVPALTEATPATASQAVDATQRVTSAEAIAYAISAFGLTWSDVEGVEWRLDEAGDYVVTLYTSEGAERTAAVDAYKRVAYAA